jgi:hypothetical protein
MMVGIAASLGQNLQCNIEPNCNIYKNSFHRN